ncbi:MAG: response regulator [Isosphaeraceae bacterium]
MRNELHILLVEDSLADVKIIERALADVQLPHRLTVVHDGQFALDYLQDLLDSDSAPGQLPDLVLLDLNLPGIDGGEVLSRVKSDPDLRSIPVIVLTTSRREEDVLQSYQDGANTYIEKPAEYARYRDLIDLLRRYWQDTALRPPRGRS